MELRQAETELNALRSSYQSLRRQRCILLPQKDDGETAPQEWHLSSHLVALDDDVDDDDDNNNDDKTKETTSISVTDALSQLQKIREALGKMEEKADKFRQRLVQKDPVTQAPRFGEKTMIRVEAFLKLYDALQTSMMAAVGSGNDNDDDDDDDKEPSFMTRLQEAALAQDACIQKSQEAQEAAEKEAAWRRSQEEEALERERWEQDAAQVRAKRAEEQELHERAQAARRAKLQEERRAQQADEDFLSAVVKGPEGVRRELQRLQRSCADDANAHTTALRALWTVLSQIVARPEEVSFRKMKRHHAQFQQDIARHEGGLQVLVACGFTFCTLDNVPCLFLKEPDLESDMDGWSKWFDVLQEAVKILQAELDRIER